ncbi:MAG TPA: SMP-30/gluconolactonase/LRE family protein [Acidimicrobiales bacterium]|jgi:sugar lactone lactonase YvrE|nr:SMP-30/gluconolactonase/LRE family protein [Acidimicrobiales bacterium]
MENYTTRVVREGLSFGEAPRWHDERLWYSDFFRHAIFSIDEEGRDERLELMVPAQPSGLGWLPDGDLLYVSMTDQRVMRRHQGESSLFSDISPYCEFWANDMAVSPSGFAYVGNFGFDLDVMLRDIGPAGMMVTPPPTTNLVVLDATGSAIQVVPDMAFPNGAVLTPDGLTLIVGETMAYRLTAFDVTADGTLANRRIWAQMDVVATDGMCLDAEGQIWLANALTNQCLRVKEGGEITAIAETSQHAFACMLGGRDRDRLFVMTAPTSNRFKIASVTDAKIEAVDVAVPGAGWP